jgi:sporulation protein YlmC with PRC-barrel domain
VDYEARAARNAETSPAAALEINIRPAAMPSPVAKNGGYTMRSLLLGAAAALAISTGAFAQTAADTKDTNSAMTPAGGMPQFIQKQEMGQVRAPKLVGVAVYDKENKSIGKIDDLLLDHDGKIQAVVIGVGGFLGMGKKDVAVPFSALQWQTEQRTVASNSAAPASGTANNTGSTTTTGAASAPAQKTVDPAATEAYNGYPDRVVINVAGDTLKNAPEFKYASETMNSDGTPANTGSATKP